MAKSSAALLWDDVRVDAAKDRILVGVDEGIKRQGLRIAATAVRPVSGAELYARLDLRRRRAQIRARRALGVQ